MTLSKTTLELCDWLIDGITLAVNHPDFVSEAARIGTAKTEVAEALVQLGGVPLSQVRASVVKD